MQFDSEERKKKKEFISRECIDKLITVARGIQRAGSGYLARRNEVPSSAYRLVNQSTGQAEANFICF